MLENCAGIRRVKPPFLPPPAYSGAEISPVTEIGAMRQMGKTSPCGHRSNQLKQSLLADITTFDRFGREFVLLHFGATQQKIANGQIDGSTNFRWIWNAKAELSKDLAVGPGQRP